MLYCWVIKKTLEWNIVFVFFYLFLSSSEFDHVQGRSSLRGEDAVLDVVVDQLDGHEVLQERRRLRLASFERRLEGLEVWLNYLIGDVESAADEAQHRVRLLRLLLLSDDVVQPTGVDRVGQKFL